MTKLVNLMPNPNGRECGNAVDFGSTNGTRWEQDMLTPKGKRVTVVYEFSSRELRDDNGEQLAAEDLPWDDKHVV